MYRIGHMQKGSRSWRDVVESLKFKVERGKLKVERD